jgi:hypothetical protein
MNINERRNEIIHLETSIQQKSSFLKDELGKLQTTYDLMEQNHQRRCQEKEEETKRRLSAIEAKC